MRIEIKKNGLLLETRDLNDGSYSIGRGPDSAIELKSQQVSTAHALLVIKDGRAAIIDVGSSNGTFVNGILVRKKRIDIGDDIAIGTFKLRIVALFAKTDPVSVEPSYRVDGNLAQKPQFSAPPEQAPPPPMAVFDKILGLMDTRILRPFYAAIKQFDWRVIIAIILGGTLATVITLCALPLVQWGRDILITESSGRAHAILRQVVRENYRVITKTNDFTRLTVETAEAESGVLAAYIADPASKSLLAPAKLYNTPIADLYIIRAIEKITQEENSKDVMVERPDGTFVYAQPIYSYAPDSTRSLQAVALLEFRLADTLHTTFTPIAEMVLLSLFFGLIAYYLLLKMFLHPVSTMLGQIDEALKGESTTITSELCFFEFETLAQNLNFALSRIRTGQNDPNLTGTTDRESEDTVILNAVSAMDLGSGDGLLLLDRDKKIRFVGTVIEDLLSLRAQYALGQNISDACRDPSFSGTAIDLCERVFQTLGESQTSTLEINGTSRSVMGVGLRNHEADIRFVLITVKMNG